MKQIVFTPWHKVSLIDGKKKEEDLNDKKFFTEMYRNLKNDNYSVFFNRKETSFIITFRGVDYHAALPNNVVISIRNHSYKSNSLASELLKLAGIKKRIYDYNSAKIEYEEKIREIEDSGYSALEDILDYEMYLTYLNEKNKVAKTDEERSLINAKIRGILKSLTNPHDLKLYIDQVVARVAKNGEELSDYRKAQLEEILHQITDDYYKEIVGNREQMLVLGSSDKPMHIIRRIVDVEMQVKKWLKENDSKVSVMQQAAKRDTYTEELNAMQEQIKGFKRG